jgi:predicted enzyme related to lactoylglutathione lyase
MTNDLFPISTALVTLANANSEKLVQFYRQFLQLEPQPYIPNIYAEFQLPGLRLGIFQPKPGHIEEFSQSDRSAMSLCLEVQDLEASIERLQQLRYPPPGKIITASHGREIYAYDPAGNRLILHQGRSQ